MTHRFRHRVLLACLAVVASVASAATATPASAAAALPRVTAVSPSAGAVGGGTRITVTGTGFTHVRSVTFGATAGTKLQVVSAGKLVVTAPRHLAGIVDVRVRTSAGASPAVSRDRFTYLARPAVRSLVPSTGRLAGGTPVTVTGSGFTRVSRVDFGAVHASSFTVVSAGRITAVAPASTTVRAVDVRVTTPGGVSAASVRDRYGYRPAPGVDAVTPSAGPLAGGNAIVVDGHDFAAVTQVLFGRHPATGVTVVSPSRLLVTAPAGSLGTADLRVVSEYGTSAVTAGDKYVYTAAPALPTVSSVVAPSPDAAVSTGPAHLLDTACTDTSCYAVGFDPEATDVPLVESLAEDGWVATAAPLPDGAESGHLSAVSCGATGCTAVGYWTSGGVTRPLVETLVDGTWTASAPPLPEGAATAAFDRVACADGTCVATGSSSGGVVLAASVGGVWQTQYAPAPALTDLARLSRVDVACGSAAHCVFAGNWTSSLGVLHAVAATWDGTAWTSALLPAVATSGPDAAGSGSAAAVACDTPTTCVIVGGWTPASATLGRPMTATDAGGRWVTSFAPLPADAVDSTVRLAAVDCAGQRCTASGQYENAAGTDGFVAVLDGGTWSAAPVAKSGDSDTWRVVLDTACVDAGRCVTVGVDSPPDASASGTVAVTGPGGATQTVVPVPGDPVDISLFHVACGASGTCSAIARLSSTPQQWLLVTIRL